MHNKKLRHKRTPVRRDGKKRVPHQLRFSIEKLVASTLHSRLLGTTLSSRPCVCRARRPLTRSSRCHHASHSSIRAPETKPVVSKTWSKNKKVVWITLEDPAYGCSSPPCACRRSWSGFHPWWPSAVCSPSVCAQTIVVAPTETPCNPEIRCQRNAIKGLCSGVNVIGWLQENCFFENVRLTRQT